MNLKNIITRNNKEKIASLNKALNLAKNEIKSLKETIKDAEEAVLISHRAILKLETALNKEKKCPQD